MDITTACRLADLRLITDAPLSHRLVLRTKLAQYYIAHTHDYMTYYITYDAHSTVDVYIGHTIHIAITILSRYIYTIMCPLYYIMVPLCIYMNDSIPITPMSTYGHTCVYNVHTIHNIDVCICGATWVWLTRWYWYVVTWGGGQHLGERSDAHMPRT